jgi:peptidyl-prolyl isomerase E (cyclophilin E)
MAKPMKIREFSTRPVWQEDAWLTEHAGKTLGVKKDDVENGEENKDDAKDSEVGAQTVRNPSNMLRVRLILFR